MVPGLWLFRISFSLYKIKTVSTLRKLHCKTEINKTKYSGQLKEQCQKAPCRRISLSVCVISVICYHPGFQPQPSSDDIQAHCLKVLAFQVIVTQQSTTTFSASNQELKHLYNSVFFDGCKLLMLTPLHEQLACWLDNMNGNLGFNLLPVGIKEGQSLCSGTSISVQRWALAYTHS